MNPNQTPLRRPAFVALILLGALFLAPALQAQSLCSGRCFVHPITFLPYCSLSLFGQWICVEGPDWCAEFDCWASQPTEPAMVRSAAGSDLLASLPPSCHQPTVTPGGEVAIHVVVLKARS